MSVFKRPVCEECVRNVIDYAGRGTGDSALAKVAELQTEGTAAIVEILRREHVALLADEVGMGKTYQALGVIALYMAAKPDARILIVAPNSNVQESWRTTFSSIGTENLVQGGGASEALFGSPTFELYNCRTLVDLGQQAVRHRRGAFLTRLKSAYCSLRQSLAAGRDKKLDPPGDGEPGVESGRVRDLWHARKIFTSCNDETAEHRSSSEINAECARQLATILPRFDLVVVDEGHNLRNRGGNIMTRTFATVTGLSLTEEVHENAPDLLLLTATPAYTSESDILRQFAFRRPDILEMDSGAARDFVRGSMVRRLRRLEGKTKYDYRLHAPVASLSTQSTDRPSAKEIEQELMLALVQKALAHDDGVKMNTSFKIGYLETFESYSPPEQAIEHIGDEGEFTDIDDGSSAPDRDLLQRVAKEVEKIYDVVPHPKMTRLEDEYERMLGLREPDKLLVFVRRRASVRELQLRLLRVFDDVSLRQLQETWGKPERRWAFRDVDAFERFVHGALASRSEVDALVAQGGKSKWSSDLLKPFKTAAAEEMSKGGYAFRKRFQSGNSLVDFFDEDIARLRGCLLERWGDAPPLSELERDIRFPQLDDQPDDSAPNFWDAAHAWAVSASSGGLDAVLAEAILPPADSWDRAYWQRREGWRSMVSKQLRMSDAIIDLFFAFLEGFTGHAHDRAAISAALRTNIFAGDTIRAVRLRAKMARSWLLYGDLTKQLDIRDHRADGGNVWGAFDNQEPVQGVLGGSSARRTAIPQFNSPFLPDVIVATDVLREGVDLHLSCRRVWHYGLPHTAGALEQQTGRVDRFFARVHGALRDSREARSEADWGAYRPGIDATVGGEREDALEVGYPYVPRSIDETQLHRLMSRFARIQPLLDEGLSNVRTADGFDPSEAVDLELRQVFDFVMRREAQSEDSLVGVSHAPPEHDGPCLFSRGGEGEAFRCRIIEFLDSLEDEFVQSTRHPLATDEGLVSLRPTEPLLVLNALVTEDSLFVDPDDAPDNARHQPVLVFLSFNPTHGLYFFEFATPCNATAADRSEWAELRLAASMLGLQRMPSGFRVVDGDRFSAFGDWDVWTCCEQAFDSLDNVPEPRAASAAVRVLMALSDDLERLAYGDDVKMSTVLSGVEATWQR